MSGSSVISNSYATVNVTGNHHVGGLIGWNFGCSISNSYSTGNITGDQNVGGLVGCNYNGAITNSYSTGIITGTDYVGGLVGWNYNGAITNSFYDSETSGQSDTGKGIPKTTSQMKDFITFNNAGWDIDYTDVDLNDGYPYLAWQNETDTSIWLIYGDTSSDHVLKVNIHTGLFRLLLYNKINATVQNTGNGTANNVNLTLSVEYGLLGLKKANKTINIISMQPNESQSIEITGLRGFGFIGINITAFSDETEKVTDTATGLILGPFIILGRKFI